MLQYLPIFLPTLFGLSTAHVSLTFPPARKYDLDFLDTVRTGTLTGSPCGMNKGNFSTDLSARDAINVTWHLGYPHRGGFKIQLLDSRGRHLQDLTPEGEWVGDRLTRHTTQSYELTVPDDLVCPNCILRLVRQASEWGEYKFKSCADVNIVPYDEWSNRCSGQGTSARDRRCKCRKPYYGRFCQYKNDCEEDKDCNNHGRCIQSEGTSVPHRECFCEPGYHGQTCQKQSPLKLKTYKPEDYQEIKLQGDKFKFLWRYIGETSDEIEGVIVAKTDSYVAIGWRPDSLTASCRNFPEDAPPPLLRGNPLHGMDCQDIIVAKVDGDSSNVGDYYTRDRSTPRRDEVYGGQDDLTAAIGWESDGVTTVMFRKPASGAQDSGKQDHNFNGKMTLIWAYGQSGVDFYKKDEFKYHSGRNRGKHNLVTSGPGSSGATDKFVKTKSLAMSCVSLVLMISINTVFHS